MNDGLDKGCLLPLAQAVISGFLTALVALAVGLWQGWEHPEYIALVVGSLGAAAWWWGSVVRWLRIAYPSDPPQVFDENNDPHPVEVQRVRVEVKHQEGQAQHTQIADLDIDAGRIAQLARGLLAGQTFSEGVWTGAGRPFSKSEFHKLRHEFIRRGWAVFRNPRSPAQGVELTKSGQAVMRSFSSLYTTPPYQGQGGS